MSLPCVEMVEADNDSVVVSESVNTKETSSYPGTSCKNIHSKKGMVVSTLLRLSQLRLNDIMSFPHWIFISPILLRLNVCMQMCKVPLE